MLVPALEGFALGGGLIIAIGAQNAFILRQGLLRLHVFVLCLIASLSDALLIILGVAGMGTFVQSNPTLLFYVTLFGAVFLLLYAFSAARRAMSAVGLDTEGQSAKSLKRAVSILLAFTFLNPHVYLDTVVLLGGVSGQYSGGDRVFFALGAVLASFSWFFLLGYGARWLAPLFTRPRSWQILDAIIALVMLTLALSLIIRAFS